MKANTLLIITITILAGIIVYLLLNMQTKTAVSREYVPVVYEDRRPRDTILVSGWGGWGFPTKPWGLHPPPPPPPGPPGPPPPGPAPPAPPAEAPSSPSTFVDMSKNVEGFFSPASYPFA